MIAQIFSIFSIIRELISLIKLFMDMADKQRKAEAERKSQELKKAIEDLKNAKTEEDIWDAQDRIVRNKP